MVAENPSDRRKGQPKMHEICYWRDRISGDWGIDKFPDQYKDASKELII